MKSYNNKHVRIFLDKLKKKMKKQKEFEFWLFLKEAKRLFEKLESKLSQSCEIEKNVTIKSERIFVGDGSKILANSYIEGNCFIGNNCKIGPNSILRGFNIIDDDVTIKFSEVKDSIILRNAKIPHFCYVGNSIIGSNCNLGAGTKIANLRFDNKNVKVIINNKKVDSKQRKLGCLMHSNVKTGVNSCINCGTIIYDNVIVMPLSFVKGVVKK